MTFSVQEPVGQARNVDETIAEDVEFSLMVALVDDVLDVDLSGAHIELVYQHNPHVSRSGWQGSVFRDEAHAGLDFMARDEATMPLLFVTLDAVSGRGLGIHRMIYDSAGPADNVTWSEVFEMTNNDLRELFPTLTEAEISTAKEATYDIAQRFFGDDVIVDITFGFHGDEVLELANFVGDSLPFTISTANQLVEIFLLRGVNELSSLHTPFTDDEVAPLLSN